MFTHALRRIYRRWLPAVLVVTALANLVANGFLPRVSQTLRPHGSGSLTHLVHTEQRTVDLRYGIYMELADALSGQTLYVPEESPLSADLARGLANVTLETSDYDAADLSAVPPRAEPLGSFQDGEERIDYWILPDGGEARWWLAQTSEGIVIVPDTAAPIPGTGP
ncbi:MAG: hypothetical protein ACLFWH_06595 [Actinomycetota bacterium]